MRLSRFTDYALRACLYLAANDDRLVPISEITKAHGLSHANLMKVVQRLVEGGILESTRGRRGGVTLARPAEDIATGEVVRVMEGDMFLVDCAGCLLEANCGLVRTLAMARRAFYATLDAVSLRDAVGAHPRTLELLVADGPAIPRAVDRSGACRASAPASAAIPPPRRDARG